MAQVNMNLRINAEIKNAFMAVAKSMDCKSGILCARPLNGSTIPGSVTRLKKDISYSNAVMCSHPSGNR
ncbi:hypothetical protein BHF58_20560 [Escherichia coli]|nr:hypothetical protein AC789_106pl01040 [Escherichia coli]OEN91516.1 hypothetical protein BHF58_20560 [Escherichia coli]OWC58191.1 hypothetical protein A8G02_14145 [Escherichia coli]BEB09113.1 hypothetical protein VEE28_44570 [Escherichia coli]BEJ31262.1 hypothetical protein OIPH1902010_46980 [Escherichia coli]